MGAKSRAMMAAARASLEARKAADLGPTAPPCVKCGEPSTGMVFAPGLRPQPVCNPLGCGIEAVGEHNFSRATFGKHPPGLYREAST